MNLHASNGAICQLVAEDEEISVFGLGKLTFGFNLFGRQLIDVLNGHAAQRIPVEPVEVCRGIVGIKNASGIRIDQHHGCAVTQKELIIGQGCLLGLGRRRQPGQKDNHCRFQQYFPKFRQHLPPFAAVKTHQIKFSRTKNVQLTDFRNDTRIGLPNGKIGQMSPRPIPVPLRQYSGFRFMGALT